MEGTLRSAICVLALAATSCAKLASPATSSETGDTTQSPTSESGTTSETTSTSTSETETGYDQCDPAQFADCWAAVEDELTACMVNCDCGDLDCATFCRTDYKMAFWDCTPGAQCENVKWEASDTCNQICEQQAVDCSCEPNFCVYLGIVCKDDCRSCPPHGSFTYEYADSCEITLPGPIPLVNTSYVLATIDWHEWGVQSSVACGDQWNPAAVWVDDQFTTLQLCQEACDAFMTAGAVTIEVASPPCE